MPEVAELLDWVLREESRRAAARQGSEFPRWDWYGPDCGCPAERRKPNGACPAHPRARDKQRPPEWDWQTWYLECGRGFGKTITGAEWVRMRKETNPPGRRFALIAPTAADVRDVMVEGESGLLSACPPWDRPEYQPSKRRVVWPNGSMAFMYSADEPERLRGPQHHDAWCLAGDTPVLLADGSEKPIRDVEVGDMVETRSGPRRVKASMLTRRNAEVFELRTFDGQVIIGTGEHRVWTSNRGFLPIDSLREGMRLCARNASNATDVISSVRRSVRRVDVYDITVEGASEFFAGGILVHNCDEPAAWRLPEAYDMLMFGLRLGKDPRCVMTTTPKPKEWLRAIKARATTVVVRGNTYENRDNLAATFFSQIIKKYEGTRLGRQELEAEDLQDTPGALWTSTLLDDLRADRSGLPDFDRIVVGVDPSVGDPGGADDESTAECGITAGGYVNMDHPTLGWVRYGWLLADRSLRGHPRVWGQAVVDLYHELGADLVVCEANNGGALVEANIHAIDPNVPVELVHASRGKVTRAEPIATYYEQRRIYHVVGGLTGREDFSKLEAQMCSYVPGCKSPDRLDAMVWAHTEGMSDCGPLVVGDAPLLGDWRG